MLSPRKILKEIISRKQQVSSIEEATAIFDSQVGAIQSIKDTPGFKEIQSYRYSIWEAAQKRL